MAALQIKILHVKGRKLVDKDLSQSRKSKLEFLHFKAVCVQTSFERVRLPHMNRMSVFIFMLGGY